MENEHELDSIPLAELLQELRAREKSKGREATLTPSHAQASLLRYDTARIVESVIARQKAIYGSDNRQDLFSVTDQAVLQSADSVVSLWEASTIIDNGDGTSTLMTESFGKSHDLCSSEPFYQQPVGAFCSGFLIAADIIATAGHCVNTNELSNVRFIFGYRAFDGANTHTVINNSDIYCGASILGWQQENDGADWALVRLDKWVTNHKVAPMRREGTITDNQGVYVIGHPCGLPAKYAPGSQVRDNTSEAFFVANLDTYGGNSGSPVFNANTHEIEGILVRGNPDFVTNGTCQVSLTCPDSGCRGEDCTRTTQFSHLVSHLQKVMEDFAYNAGGWRVEQHPRFLADLTGNRCADIVGFGHDGVWVALNNDGETFHEPQLAIKNFGYGAGWRVEQHPRFIADLTGNGCADIIGFGNDGVWVAINNGDGSFGNARLIIRNLGYGAGNWRVDKHPRLIADLTGNGCADIVGFGNDGVWVAINNGDGSFHEPQLVLKDFAYTAGGWRVEQHPRFLADLTGNACADIVGFGNDGVWVALNNGDGTFGKPQLALKDFAYTAGGWRVEQHPRFLADLTGNGCADIVGFGNDGVWVAMNNGDGSFRKPQLVLKDFGYTAGGWRVEQHPRFLADLTGNGCADIVGFGHDRVWAAFSDGDGTFSKPLTVVKNFAYTSESWRVEKHPRLLADLNSDGRMDIVGFGDSGVWIWKL